MGAEVVDTKGFPGQFSIKAKVLESLCTTPRGLHTLKGRMIIRILVESNSSIRFNSGNFVWHLVQVDGAIVRRIPKLMSLRRKRTQ